MHNSKHRVILNQKGTKQTLFGISGLEKKIIKNQNLIYFFSLLATASRGTKLKKKNRF